MNEYYRRLGVAPEADGDTIKKAYRRLARELHPDRHPDDPHAAARFQEINEAYTVLSDPEKRKEYDAVQKVPPKQATGKKASAAKRTPKSATVDFSQMQSGFASFFGFDPATGEVVDEGKVSGQGGKNPLDTTDLFERFMGVK